MSRVSHSPGQRHRKGVGARTRCFLHLPILMRHSSAEVGAILVTNRFENITTFEQILNCGVFKIGNITSFCDKLIKRVDGWMDGWLTYGG